jgi:hypothetical protein
MLIVVRGECLAAPQVVGAVTLIAVARYLGAHSPTEQAALQTGDIARLRGGELHQETARRDEASTRSAQECEATIQSAHRVRSEGRGRYGLRNETGVSEAYPRLRR